MNEPDLKSPDDVLQAIKAATLELGPVWGETTSGQLRGCLNGAICCPLSIIYLHRTGRHLSPRTRLWQMASEMGIPRHLTEAFAAAADLRRVRSPIGQMLPAYEADLRAELEQVTIHLLPVARPHSRARKSTEGVRKSNRRPKPEPARSLKERRKEFLPGTQPEIAQTAVLVAGD